MSNVDRFESMFRAAAREVYRHEVVAIDSVLVVTDRDEAGARAFGDEVRGFLKVLSDDARVQWRDVPGSEFATAEELLERVASAGPAMICTYRNLHSSAWRWPYSLGTHLDVLTQHTDVPVMVLPHPEARRSADHALENTDTVMAITDHLTGDERLVNYAVRFTQDNGTLWLTHVENQLLFERYMDAVSKIPDFNTDDVRDTLGRQLLKDPREYIEGCADVLKTAGLPITVEKLVTFGHHLPEYQKLIAEHHVDLLVLHTKDDDQLAMSGIAYELAVEMRQIPLLML